MNKKKNGPPQAHAASPLRAQQTGHFHPHQKVMQSKKPVPQSAHKLPALQPQPSGPCQTRKMTIASAAYRPQLVPRVLQTKTAARHQPHSQSGRASSSGGPVAPPVYRPQPVPKVLQTKSAPGQPSKMRQLPRQTVAPSIHGPQQKRTAQPKMTATAQAHRPLKAPPAYSPQPTPKVLQAKGSQSRAAVPDGRQQPLSHQAHTGTAPYNLAHSARATVGGVVQARLSMDNTGNLDYNGDPVGPDLNDPDVESLLDSLEDDANFTQSEIRKVEKIIETEPLYNFRGPKHLASYLADPDDDPPTLVHDKEGAMMLDDISGEFGSTFKVKGVPFSGSRVYALAHSEGETSLWAMQNSATGYITKGNQNIVNTWNLAEVKMPIEFPTNAKGAMDKASLKRPTVMSANAHAEVNEILHHAYRALKELHRTPHDVGLMFGSDIQHCAECYWAAQAMWKKGNKVPFNATGCGNRLFARWREPWSGFYTEYGDNPFRKPNGTLRGNLTVGEYQAHVLNALVAGSVGNIYK